MKVGIAFIEGRTPQGPAHGQVSVLPGISTCHQLKVSGTCKAHSEGGGGGRSHQGQGLAGQEGRVSLAKCFCQHRWASQCLWAMEGPRLPGSEVGSSTQRGVPQA